jgi:hypothetical protein
MQRQLRLLRLRMGYGSAGVRSAGTIFALLAAAFVAGCGGGSDGDYANEPRPPSPINVTARVGDDDISVSPKSFGAGPISLIISNQTDEPQELTFETDELGGEEAGLAPQSTGPIRPTGTATIKVDVREGSYVLRAGSGAKEASIEVGAPRPSAQNELLQP